MTAKLTQARYVSQKATSRPKGAIVPASVPCPACGAEAGELCVAVGRVTGEGQRLPANPGFPPIGTPLKGNSFHTARRRMAVRKSNGNG